MGILTKDERYYHKGIEYYNSGNFNKSFHYFELALDNGYHSGDVYSAMGKIFLYQLKIYEAIELFSKAIVHSDPGVGIDYYLGLCYYFLGNENEANEQFYRALKHSSVYYVRCKAFEMLSTRAKLDEKERKELLENNLNIPDNINTEFLSNYLCKALLERFKGNYLKSNEILTALTIKNPHYFETYKELAKNYTILGEYDKAIAFYKKAKSKCYDDKSIHHYLALVYYNVGDYSKTRNELKILTKYITTNYKYFYNLGNIDYKLEKYSEAIKYYQYALKNNQGFYKIHYNLGTVYQKMGLLNESLEAYKKAIHINPASIRSYYNLGILYLLQKNYFEALNNLMIAKEMQPNNNKVNHNFNIIKGLKYIDPAEKLENGIPVIVNIFLFGLSILLVLAIVYFLGIE